MSSCSTAPDAPTSLSSSSGTSAASNAIEDFVTTSNGLRVDYNFDAVTNSSTGTRIVNQPDLTFHPDLAPGANVSPGAVVGRYSIESHELARLRAASRHSTVAASRLWLLSQTTGPVHAPIAGVWSPADAGGEIRAPGIEATAQLVPLAGLRLAGTRFDATATVETVFGQQTVDCLATWILVSSPGSEVLHCRLPDGLETAAGLPASIRMRAAISTKGVAVPFRFVGFDQITQSYFVLELANGRPTRRLVVVGQTDGVLRYIVSGLGPSVHLRPVDGS